MMTIADGYYIEQAVGLTIFGLLLFGNTLQLWIEWKAYRTAKSTPVGDIERVLYLPNGQPLSVGDLQVIFHRLGFLIALWGTIGYIDPYAIHGILPYGFTFILTEQRSDFCLLGCAYALSLPIELLYRISLHREAPKVYQYGMIAMVAIQVLWANSLCLYDNDGRRHYWVSGFAILSYAVTGISLTLGRHLGMWGFRRQISKLHATSRDLLAMTRRSEPRNLSGGSALSSDLQTALLDHSTDGDHYAPSTEASASLSATAVPKLMSYSRSRTPLANRSLADTVRGPLRNMTIFQISATVPLVIGIAWAFYLAADRLSHPLTEVHPPVREIYPRYRVTADCGITIVHILSSVIGLWYAYLPVSVLWTTYPSFLETRAAVAISRP